MVEITTVEVIERKSMVGYSERELSWTAGYEAGLPSGSWAAQNLGTATLHVSRISQGCRSYMASAGKWPMSNLYSMVVYLKYLN